MVFEILFSIDKRGIRRRSGFYFYTIPFVLGGLLLLANAASVEVPRPRLLSYSSVPNEQSIRFVVMDPRGLKAVCSSVRLSWEPKPGLSEEPLVFDFDLKAAPQLKETWRSQLWISSLIVASGWQQPWQSAHWTLKEISFIDGAPMGAALAIGLIATAANVPFPQDATILGSLNPDGALGPVSNICKRIEAAKSAGLKRLFISNLQRFDVTPEGSIINVQNFAQKLGIEVLFVDHLIEATERMLHQRLPDPPQFMSDLHYSKSLFDFLDQNCRKEMGLIQEGSKSWPRKPELLAKFTPEKRELWQRLFIEYDSALDAYQAGLLYVSHKRFQKSNSWLKALANLSKSIETYDFKGQNIRATELRLKAAKQMDHPLIDHNDLQSGLNLAEENDWIYEITAPLEGAQILAHQAFGPRSEATPPQKKLSAFLLTNAISRADYLLEKLDFYSELHHLIQQQQPPPGARRVSVQFPQLMPVFLAASEDLAQGLRLHSRESLDLLLFDPRIATHARVLQDARLFFEEQNDRKEKEEFLRIALTQPPRPAFVGFSPGSLYTPPTPPVPPPTLQKLSETARTLKWVNDFCEVSMLQQKYLGSGGDFESSSQVWKKRNHARLQRMLQNADITARQGIAFAEKAGVDPSILLLIYERASFLRETNQESDQLEALRHFWRCGLLGNLCIQLSAPAEVAKPVEVIQAPPVARDSTLLAQQPLRSPLNPPALLSVPEETLRKVGNNSHSHQ